MIALGFKITKIGLSPVTSERRSPWMIASNARSKTDASFYFCRQVCGATDFRTLTYIGHADYLMASARSAGAIFRHLVSLLAREA
jgi:hypothetical protein